VKKSINEWMVILKTIRGRRAELSDMRRECSTETKWYDGGSPSKVVEPKYDVKMLDKKCTNIQNAEFLIETAIKQSNAKVQIDIDVDVQDLIKPLE